jgi:hypothetical protein
MRMMTAWRAGGLLAVLALAGCDSGRGGGSGSGVAPAGGTTTAASVGGGASPRDAAEALLRSLGEGKLTPDQLTPYFRAAIAPPQTEDERKAGYSDAQVREWLQAFAGTKFAFLEQTKFGNAVVERGRAESGDSKVAFTLRLAREDAGYKIDWLHRSTQLSLVASPADPDLLAAQDTVRNFLDLLLGGDLRQAQALMAPAWRKQVAPPTPREVRNGLDYDPGFLTQTMRSWKGGAAGYTFPKATLGPNKDTAAFTAELGADGRNTAWAVKAAKDSKTGRWLVTDFDKQ